MTTAQTARRAAAADMPFERPLRVEAGEFRVRSGVAITREAIHGRYPCSPLLALVNSRSQSLSILACDLKVGLLSFKFV